MSFSPELTAELAAAAERGRILAEAQNFTRDLVNEPANLLTPLLMAAAAQKMAAEATPASIYQKTPLNTEPGKNHLLIFIDSGVSGGVELNDGEQAARLMIEDYRDGEPGAGAA